MVLQFSVKASQGKAGIHGTLQVTQCIDMRFVAPSIDVYRLQLKLVDHLMVPSDNVGLFSISSLFCGQNLH